jgi:hypothetical protein
MRTVLVALLAAAVATTAPAAAKRRPTSGERTAIVTVVKHFLRFEASRGYRDNRVTTVRVSTANRRWARANTSSPTVGRASAILELTRTKGWRVRNFGVHRVQCIAEAPRAVKLDLYGSASCPFEP